MATDTTRTFPATSSKTDVGPAPGLATVGSEIKTVLLPFASLRLTVLLFGLSIFLIFVGTLAQVEQNMWEVLDGYFQTWFAWIDFRVLLPISFFPNRPEITGGFWFPGGYLLGLLLGLNLLAAHAVRFTVQAQGHAIVVGIGCGRSRHRIDDPDYYERTSQRWAAGNTRFLLGYTLVDSQLDCLRRLVGFARGRRADGSHASGLLVGSHSVCLLRRSLRHHAAIRQRDSAE